jgi:hypothetical protein
LEKALPSGGFTMVDVEYVRGWQDCLDAVDEIAAKAKSLEEVKDKIQKLQKLVKQDKFEKIRCELGAYNIF